MKGSSNVTTSSNTIPVEEINTTLNKIFDSVSEAIKKKDRKVTLDNVDKTLNALFDAVNKVHSEGKNVKLPNFEKILND